MNLMLDALWRAAAYCLRPRVMLLSLLPLILMVILTLAWGYYFWDDSLAWVRDALEGFAVVQAVSGWLTNMGWSNLQSVLAPMVVIFLATPVIVVLSLLLVALMMTPALVHMVAASRFAQLEKKQGGSWWGSALWSIWSSVAALAVLLLSLPLWLIPPVILIVPPLIWGWLTYRVMAYDALADHASADERRVLLRRHRWSLLGMGVVCGFLGAAPGLIWVSGALLAAAFVVLVPLAVWLYMLVFAFSSLWFTHFCLSALQGMRAEALHNAGPALASNRPESQVGQAPSAQSGP
jgi:hypothetical protein